MSKAPLTPFARLERFWKNIGPGLVTGAADDDPSGIATYSQAGAKYGLQFTWLTLFTFPLMAVVQEMCARIGVVTGQGLAANIRKHFSPSALYVTTGLLFVVNTLNIAADLGAMAAATKLIFPAWDAQLLIIAFALVSVILPIFMSYGTYATYLKYLTFALLSYVAVALMVDVPWGEVLRATLVPTLSFAKEHILLVCAVLGTTFSPYLFFWQTSQEIEERIKDGDTTVQMRRHDVHPKTIRNMRVDVWTGMFLSNLIAFFVIVACASTLHVQGITEITTAGDAAAALKPFGESAALLFTLGILATGFIAVPVLAGSTAYALAESFRWRYGFYRTWSQAHAFYGVIIASVVLGIIANLIGLDPIKGLILAAILNGIIAPVVLFFIIRLASNHRVMGEYVNRPLTSIIGWLTLVIMKVAAIAALVFIFI